MKKKLSVAFAVRAVPSTVLKTIAVLLIEKGMETYAQDPWRGIDGGGRCFVPAGHVCVRLGY